MTKLWKVVAGGLLCIAGAAYAGDKYNDVSSDADDQKQYLACKTYSLTKYEGGEKASPIAGQTRAEAFCTCMWNETADDFKGSLAKFAETEKGKRINKICEKYADWES
jgi:hypothetical protein